MRICLLEEVAVVKDLLCAVLTLRHHHITAHQVPLMCLESLAMECSYRNKFELLIIGDHPQTSFSWRQVVEQVHTILPDLPIIIISNMGQCISNKYQLPYIKVLDEPFHLDDFYAIIDELEK